MFPWPPSEGRRVDGAPTLRTPLERRERNGSPQKSANRRMTEPRETGADDSNNNHQRSAQREQRHGGTQRLDMASRFIEGNMATETPSVAPPRAEVPMVDAEVRAGPSHRHARRAAGDRGPWVSLPLRATIPEGNTVGQHADVDVGPSHRAPGLRARGHRRIDAGDIDAGERWGRGERRRRPIASRARPTRGSSSPTGRRG